MTVDELRAALKDVPGDVPVRLVVDTEDTPNIPYAEVQADLTEVEIDYDKKNIYPPVVKLWSWLGDDEE